jgi:hypothetical protein
MSFPFSIVPNGYNTVTWVDVESTWKQDSLLRYEKLENISWKTLRRQRHALFGAALFACPLLSYSLTDQIRIVPSSEDEINNDPSLEKSKSLICFV